MHFRRGESRGPSQVVDPAPPTEPRSLEGDFAKQQHLPRLRLVTTRFLGGSLGQAVARRDTAAARRRRKRASQGIAGPNFQAPGQVTREGMASRPQAQPTAHRPGVVRGGRCDRKPPRLSAFFNRHQEAESDQRMFEVLADLVNQMKALASVPQLGAIAVARHRLC